MLMSHLSSSIEFFSFSSIMKIPAPSILTLLGISGYWLSESNKEDNRISNFQAVEIHLGHDKSPIKSIMIGSYSEEGLGALSLRG